MRSDPRRLLPIVAASLRAMLLPGTAPIPRAFGRRADIDGPGRTG